jgi:hypothetical protein
MHKLWNEMARERLSSDLQSLGTLDLRHTSTAQRLRFGENHATPKGEGALDEKHGLEHLNRRREIRPM